MPENPGSKSESKNDSKNISVNSTISLKGLVKAIFKDTIHVQVGGKVITLPLSDIQIFNNKPLSE